MPGFNGTGPMGRGPMTGGGRGYCTPSGRGSEQVANRGNLGGRGLGRGFGQGFGRKRSMEGWRPDRLDGFAGPGNDNELQNQRSIHAGNISNEAESLRMEIEGLKNTLEGVRKSIAYLQRKSF
jgi:hypothetical protein